MDAFNKARQAGLDFASAAVTADRAGDLHTCIASYQQACAALRQAASLCTPSPGYDQQAASAQLLQTAAAYEARWRQLVAQHFPSPVPNVDSENPPSQHHMGGTGDSAVGERKAAPDSPSQRTTQLIELARDSLSHALRLDEAGRGKDALPKYAAAVERFIAARDSVPASNTSLRTQLEKRATEILERAEAIKNPKPVFPASTQHAATGSGGVTSAADLAKLFPDAPSVPIVPSAGAGAGAGARPTSMGGGIPSAARGPARSVARSMPHTAKSNRNSLSRGEKAVLKRSSFVNKKMYLPFIAAVDLAGPSKEQFSFPPDAPFEDPDGLLALSPKQRKHLAGWKRPSEYMRDPTMIKLVSPYSITQDLVSDCSFVASLCITSAYERRFKKQLITKIIYPQDRLGVPVYNPGGKYLVKLHFNGVERKVIVDDRLPVDKRGKPLCSFSNAGNELWVSIIEKAYLKVNGGYDFPGSNSGIDLFCLTGWIPEHFRFDAEDFDKERTWQRLVSGHKYGDCLITIATGKMSEAEEEKWGLVQTHAYAVLGVTEVAGIRLLQVKNPWAHKRWKGAYSANDTKRWTPFLQGALQYDPKNASQFDNGIFWIDYDSMLRFYRSIYFNWNPGLFACRKALHASWDLKAPGPVNDTYNIGYNPQFGLIVNVPRQINGRVGATAAVWLVLSRHVTRTEVTDTSRDREGRIGAGGTQGDPNMDYLALHVYTNEGSGDGDTATTVVPRRKFYPRNPMVRGVYSNNPNTLVRFDAKPGRHCYTLVVSQYKRLRTIDFSLFAFAMAPVAFTVAANPFKEVFVVGEWTAASAGGNPRHPRYFDNPQFALTVKSPGDLILRLEAPVGFASQVRVLACGGQRAVDSKSLSTEIATSGDYRHGFSCGEAHNVPPGSYTVVVSTFKPGQLGRFKLIVGHSTDKPSVRPLGGLGAGMHKQVVKGQWSTGDGSAAGCSNYHSFGQNPSFVVQVNSNCNMILHLQVHGVEPMPSMNAALFKVGGAVVHTEGRVPNDVTLGQASLTTNKGVYSNPPGGVYSENASGGGVECSAGKYIAVVSTFKPLSASFTFTVWNSGGPGAVVVRRL